MQRTMLYQFNDQFISKTADLLGYNPPLYYMFGDSGLPLLEWLIIPYRARQENDTRKDANTLARL